MGLSPSINLLSALVCGKNSLATPIRQCISDTYTYSFMCFTWQIYSLYSNVISFKDLCTSALLFRKCTELNFYNPCRILPFLKHECRPMICAVDLPVNGKLNRIQSCPLIRQSIVRATPPVPTKWRGKPIQITKTRPSGMGPDYVAYIYVFLG